MPSYHSILKGSMITLLIIGAILLSAWVTGLMVGSAQVQQEPINCGGYHKFKYDRGEVPIICYEKFKDLTNAK